MKELEMQQLKINISRMILIDGKSCAKECEHLGVFKCMPYCSLFLVPLFLKDDNIRRCSACIKAEKE